MRIIRIAALSMFAVVSLLLAGTARAAGLSYEEFVVSGDCQIAQPSGLSIDGATLIWLDDLGGRHVQVHDLATGAEQSVLSTPSLTGLYSPGPSISGGLVVSYISRADDPPTEGVYAYDLMAGQEFMVRSGFPSMPLDSYRPFYPSGSAVSNGVVVWEYFRWTATTQIGIHGINLVTGDDYAVADAYGPNGSYARNPSIYNDLVVWQDYRNSPSIQEYYEHWTGADVYGRWLSSGEEFLLSDAGGEQTNPVVDGTYVVWQDTRNGNSDIYAYDLLTGEEFAVCTDAAAQTSPAISGDLIVWQDNRNGNWDIYGYDLTAGQEIVFCDNAFDQLSPAISGETVAWVDLRNGQAIYAAIPAMPVTMPGDTNADGRVDLADLGVLATYWSRDDVTGREQGDLNSDGAVNLADLGILASNWGAGASTVPEPATIGLLAIGGVALRRRRR